MTACETGDLEMVQECVAVCHLDVDSRYMVGFKYCTILMGCTVLVISLC